MAGVEDEQPSNSLISSLSTDYNRKQKDKEKYQKKLKKTQISFTTDANEEIIDQIMQIIRKEYKYRIENPEKIPDFYLPFSEIANQIERATRINPGELYKILATLSTQDIELELIGNPEEPEDKKIRFIPFSDESMIYSLANFRPNEYIKIKNSISRNFERALKSKKEKRTLFQLKKNIPDQTEMQHSMLELLNNLYKYYPLYTEHLNRVPNNQKLIQQLEKWKRALEKQILS